MRRPVRRVCRGLIAACVIALSLSLPGTPSLASGAIAATCPNTGAGVHYYAPGTGKTVALTFDDGPGRDTARIIKILADAHVEATFFNLGMYEARFPATVRAEWRAGFTLGDHTWDHRDLSTMPASDQLREIDRERKEQASITGAYSCLLRPPYGDYDAGTLRIAHELEMRVWYWSVDTEDWKAAGSADPYWVHRIVARAEAGARLAHPVILMHNQYGGNPATVAALPRIINFYKERGYRFVDVYGHLGHPVVLRLSPTSGPTSGTTTVTVIGRGFRGVQAVRFGTAAGTHVHVVSSTELTVVAPRHVAGRVNVRVVTTFGASPVVAADVFRYLPA